MSNVSTEIKSVQEIVRERMQGQIAGLIPDEVLNAMLDKAVADMMLDERIEGKISSKIYTTQDSYGRSQVVKVSLLRSIIENLVYEEYFERCKKIISSDEMKQVFDQGVMQPAELMKEAVAANADLLIKKMFVSMMANNLQDTVVTIQNELNNRGLGRGY